MGRAPRDLYARLALDQIPRLLGNQDRNPYSPTYGCFHRDYWLDKTSDFPDAVRQFAAHALALVYRHDFPGNIYRGHPKVRDWTIAGLDFWARIQHREGSFDEFYPYERGWAGPTAFTTFAASEAYRLLGEEILGRERDCVRDAIGRAARFIARGQSEKDHLANHHAMACLAVWKAHHVTGDADLKDAFQHLWEGFLAYHDSEEGWSREYDGVDPGYLSAVVSFLGKVYADSRDARLLETLRQSAEFCSYFSYPNGSYGGSTGSRNTLHFYPHGFEVLAPEVPIAAALAEHMLAALADGKLVPPGIMSDRYVAYRVPEFLQAYLDYTERPAALAPLPYERPPFRRYFPSARVFVSVEEDAYVVANLAKGGVVKAFDRRGGRLLTSDCGIVGSLVDGRVVTSQWIDPEYRVEVGEDGWRVDGSLHVVASNKLFTPVRNLVFRAALIAVGWIPAAAHMLKGRIRRALMLGRRSAPVRFTRRFRIESRRLVLTDEVRLEEGARLSSLSIGDEFSVRYVPQSRYFQPQELDVSGRRLQGEEIARLNETGGFSWQRELGP